MNKKVLVVSVHPDDETLGCGGTILKHKDDNDEIYWLILTEANQKIETIQNFNALRNKFIKEASDEYGFENTFKLKYPTTQLDTYPLGEVIADVKKIFQSIQPEIVYIPNRSDVQSDHRIAFDVVYPCTKNFRAPYINKIIMYETLSETEFAAPLPENVFIPNCFIDITSFMEKKKKIMKIFTSEIMEDPHPRSISTIEALARFRGSRIGVKYAEAFMILYEMIR